MWLDVGIRDAGQVPSLALGWSAYPRSTEVMLASILVGVVFLVSPAPSQQPSLDDPPAPSVPVTAPRPEAVTLEERLAMDRAAEAAWLKRVALIFSGEPGPELASVQQEVATIMRLRGARLGRRAPDWPAHQINAMLALLQIDPRRFTHDSDFRANVFPVLRDGLSDAVPIAARRRMARQLVSLEYGPSERLLVAWGLASRTSRDREVLFGAWPVRMGAVEPIRVSIYSLPSRYFRFPEAAAFLRGMHRLAPQRTLVVLSDQPLVDELQSLTNELPLALIDSFSRHYTPWPRDPFVVANDSSDHVRLLVRPNAQARRDGDVTMAREIIRGLPEALDDAWGGVEWSVAPVPFHGGHTLATPGTTWASVHTLMPRIVEIMGEHPTPAGLQHAVTRARFVAAIGTARQEFEAVFGQPLRFVHPLPSPHADETFDFAEMLIGGGTSDLDSLVTVLRTRDGKLTALVADFDLGSALLAEAPEEDLDAFGELYHLELSGNELRGALLEQQRSPTDELIAAFLDRTAAHLRGEGLEVARLPLLHVPEPIVEPELRLDRDGFLVTWTNVVYEENNGTVTAEGFAGGLPSLDENAREVFRNAGVELRLTPTLALSVLRDGGYRCASNHVR